MGIERLKALRRRHELPTFGGVSHCTPGVSHQYFSYKSPHNGPTVASPKAQTTFHNSRLQSSAHKPTADSYA